MKFKQGTHRFRLFLFCVFVAGAALQAQPERWQQRVRYEMAIDMDVQTHRYRGSQRITYSNNSPDTLHKIFYHLYFNAFQPGSMMDVRAQTLEDADPRLSSRLPKLTTEEQGWIKVRSLRHNGAKVDFETNETILEVTLDNPILPHSNAQLDMEWDAQVPVQVRRSGRDNREGIAYSMAQWYPKLCEYDYQGWHANPYIAREFYGVWGDFDVRITIDKSYIVAAGGYLQNPQEIGYGYEEPGTTLQLPPGDQYTYHFFAPDVHDFVWAADPDYAHTKFAADDGTVMHFFWQKDKGYDKAWQDLPAIMNRARTIINQYFGKYPYNEYYFIQGGDGGMEYPLATLITGNRGLNSLVGVSVHEQLHSWYQMVLGTNESLYAWMDEGFTSYAETIVANELAREGLLGARQAKENPFSGTMASYTAMALSGQEEPLTTHADHFKSSYAYSMAAYTKGAVFLHQLEYIIGKAHLAKGLLRYFDTWKFKHPNANDLIRVFEKQSGLELDWYKEDFVHRTHTIDYALQAVEPGDNKTTRVVIERKGRMAMPLDILVSYANGDQELFYAPLESMRGVKPPESQLERTVLPDHRWVDPVYTFDIPEKARKVTKVEIDPSGRLADVQRGDNVWEQK
ncbi:MAG: M1 family metallopeptidase [Saprospirales bacterium]|nr:M1 family metallopeptidase [Saprospirales bacterium]